MLEYSKNIISFLFLFLTGIASFELQAQNDATNDGLALTLESGLTFTMSGAYTNQTNGANLGTINNAGTITLTGDWTNNSANNVFTANTGVTYFLGTAAQSIAGSNTTNFSKLRINNTAGVTLTTASVVQDSLNLKDGIVTATALLTLNSGAVSNDGTATAFVDGTMKKIGNANYIFPTGNGTVWAPIEVSGFTAGDATTEFEASYSYTTPASGLLKDTSVIGNKLRKISWVEGWDLNHAGGTAPTVKVTLHWKDQSRSGTAIGTAAVASDLVVAHWNGTKWESIGQSAHTDGAIGSVTSNAQSSFSPFTFGSLTVDRPSWENDITLPVEMVSFSSIQQVKSVKVIWKTATEINNDYFIVEKSRDGINFETLEVVGGKGNFSGLSEYALEDNSPYNGINYYRLKQVDFDGTVSYSKVSTAYFNNKGSDVDFRIFPNPIAQNGHFSLVINGQKEQQQVLVVLKDVTGKEYYSKVFVVEHQHDFVITVDPAQNLSPGVYIVTASLDNSLYNKKLIVR